MQSLCPFDSQRHFLSIFSLHLSNSGLPSQGLIIVPHQGTQAAGPRERNSSISLNIYALLTVSSHNVCSSHTNSFWSAGARNKISENFPSLFLNRKTFFFHTHKKLKTLGLLQLPNPRHPNITGDAIGSGKTHGRLGHAAQKLRQTLILLNST